MALIQADTLQKTATGFAVLSLQKQVMIFIGIALAVAIGVAVVLWSQKPDYRPLFGEMSLQDTNEMMDALSRAGIEYKMDNNRHVILVPSENVYHARILLASEGLPQGDGKGFEMLDKKQGFGTSQFMEQTAYLRALEGELSRTIAHFNGIKSARVHLAIPKPSVFVRDEEKASASVFVSLYGGKYLSNNNVSAIVHMVASSIPNLDSKDVTVVDQNGRLLTDANGSDAMSVADRQLRYTKEVEQDYARKIEELLAPILGDGKIKARVSADIDFTHSEQTRELFNPNAKVLRSEQSMQESRNGGSSAGGVPGSLSNQPPAAPTASGGTATVSDVASIASGPAGSDMRTQFTKNYELDKTISHSRAAVGMLTKLSVAVLVDDRTEESKRGKVTRTPLTQEEITQITTLVKQAIGFNSQRGDTVSVINKAFATPEAAEPMPEPSFFEQSWFWSMMKQSLAGLFVLLVIFGVVRPMLKNFSQSGRELEALEAKLQTASVDGMSGSVAVATPDGMGNAAVLNNDNLEDYQEHLLPLRKLAEEDPKRVAQVIKGWMEKD